MNALRVQHNFECRKAHEIYFEKLAEFQAKFPWACRICKGVGVLDNGDTCPQCVDDNHCPRCGKVNLPVQFPGETESVIGPCKCGYDFYRDTKKGRFVLADEGLAIPVIPSCHCLESDNAEDRRENKVRRANGS